MDKYMGTKLVEATPVIKVNGKVYDLEEPIPRSMNRQEGYKIVYPDGYESFCPKNVFKKAYLRVVNNERLASGVSVSQSMVDEFIKDIKTQTLTDTAGHPITVTIATLRNGFTITESAACVDAKNYSEAIGEEINVKHIKDQIWGYLGFMLSTAVNGIGGQL